MKLKVVFCQLVTISLILLIAVPPGTFAQEAASGEAQIFRQEELDQMLAPIALYPDSLLSQVLMASTYPLEIVQANRWAKQNKGLKGDALANKLEQEPWDPSVKSLLQFPEVLEMMSDKLDWTQKVGDAFLAQQNDVMDTVQKLRAKAEQQGNLKTTSEQKVIVEKETQTIIIQPANPQVIYVPTYNPTVVYGTWWYPAYPPYYYYPPGYTVGAAVFGFATGVAIGAAWGYAWGHADWHHHDVRVNVNQNININRNINRNKYVEHYGRGDGNWKHNPSHRKGVAYRDNRTAQHYNRAGTRDAVKARENFRGRAEQGRRDISRGDADQLRSRDRDRRGPEGKDKVQSRDAAQTRDKARDRDMSRDRVQSRDAAQARDRARDRDMKGRDTTRGDAGKGRDRGGSAFSGMDRGGKATRDISSRGSSSRQSMSSGNRGGGKSRGGGGGGGSRGGSRGGGGGGRGRR